jgi:hypothetical protein
MRYGQQIISLREMMLLAASLPNKVSYYGRVYFGRKVASWIRTDRTKIDE